jgi:hypothetical protein
MPPPMLACTYHIPRRPTVNAEPYPTVEWGIPSVDHFLERADTLRLGFDIHPQ